MAQRRVRRAPDCVFLTGPPAICRIRFSIFAILLGFCTAANIASAEKAEAWTALHTGRHAALMCHTDAPGGAGDPAGLRLGPEQRTERVREGVRREHVAADGGRVEQRQPFERSVEPRGPVKRQRELKKNKQQEEKRQKKLARSTTDDPDAPTPPPEQTS